MNTADRIEILSKWGAAISTDAGMEAAVHKASLYNSWFTVDNTQHMLKAITTQFLNKDALTQWLAKYQIPNEPSDIKVGIIMAGNLPLVGFHDLLCVLAVGQIASVKLSSKDEIMLPHLVKVLETVSPEMAARVEFAERLSGFDAVIATGGNNTGRYFEQYFGKYPHIIRRNRNSVAVLEGNETRAELMRLGDDIFRYFGLGCRNVSKIYVPRGYDLTILLDALEPFSTVMLHDKYKNNYDYQRTLLLLNQTPHLASEFLSIREKDTIISAISTLNYEYYDSLDEVMKALAAAESDIQVVVSKLPIDGAVALGKSQQPELWDYADKVDTIAFLTSVTKH